MTMRLLIADDNAAMQKMVRLAFAGENAVIETVSSGDAALDVLQEFRPDVVLADVSMPGYSGYEVCELIRQDPEFSAVPVILLNGAFDPFDEEEAARVAASGHLTKPFDPSEMISMVEKLLLESTQGPVPDFYNAEADNKTDEVYAESRNMESNEPFDFFHVTPRVLESYLGQNCVLEIFDSGTPDRNAAADRYISDELVDRVAERVAEKIFPDMETFIRQALTAHKST